MHVIVDGVTHKVDIESHIMDCWSVLDYVQSVTEGVLEHDWSDDDTSNALIGLKTIYDLRFQKLMQQYTLILKSGALRQLCVPPENDSVVNKEDHTLCIELSNRLGCAPNKTELLNALDVLLNKPR
jgi:hypothetical protein